jgi:hypothetical protein
VPSTWNLRRRPTSPSEEEQHTQEERYAARLEELLRPRTAAGAASDEAAEIPSDEAAEAPSVRPAPPALAGETAARSRGALEAGATARRVPVRIEPTQTIVVIGERPGAGSDATPKGRGSAGGSGRRARVSRGNAARTRAPKTPPPAAPVACPNCAALLQPPPASSRRCPRCRERIVVRRAAGRTVYLTEAALPIYEAERRRAIDHGRYVHPRDRWLRLATAAGAPDERVRQLASGVATEGSVAAARALYMKSVDHAFRTARREHRWESAERIRRDQARVLYRSAGRPQPPPDDIVALYREGVSIRLRGISEVAREAELTSASCCEACAADDGHTFRISGELREPRLPHPGCPDGLCRCRWALAARDLAELRRLMRLRPRSKSTGGADRDHVD